MRTITILNETLPSWNKWYNGKHWAKKQKMANDWHELVYLSCVEQKIPRLNRPGRQVEIIVKCFFKNRRVALDPDNICAKIAIDGLKGLIIDDDTYRHIKRVSTESYVDRDNPRTEIIIRP